MTKLLNQATLELTTLSLHEGEVSRETVTTISPRHEFRERTKIDVPMSLPCELRLNFVGKDGSDGYYEEFEKPSQCLSCLLPVKI